MAQTNKYLNTYLDYIEVTRDWGILTIKETDRHVLDTPKYATDTADIMSASEFLETYKEIFWRIRDFHKDEFFSLPLNELINYAEEYLLAPDILKISFKLILDEVIDYLLEQTGLSLGIPYEVQFIKVTNGEYSRPYTKSLHYLADIAFEDILLANVDGYWDFNDRLHHYKSIVVSTKLDDDNLNIYIEHGYLDMLILKLDRGKNKL